MFKFKLGNVTKVISSFENTIKSFIGMLNKGVDNGIKEINDLETKLEQLKTQLTKAQEFVSKLSNFVG